MLSTIGISNDEIELSVDNYYWIFKDETFKLSKIKELKQNIISYVEVDIKYCKETREIELFELDQVFNVKDKSLFKYFDKNQVNPKMEDLASTNIISYASILYNFKFKKQTGVRLTKAGKLFIGVDTMKINKSESTEINKFNTEIKDLVNNLFSGLVNNSQSLLINGASATGKFFFIKQIYKLIINISEQTYTTNFTTNITSNKENDKDINFNYNLSLFTYFEKALNIIDLFGKAEVKNNSNSSRFMQMIRFKFRKVKKINFLQEVKIKHFLFEKNRITGITEFIDKDQEYSFHAFHALIYGLHYLANVSKDNDLKETVELINEKTKKYFVDNNSISSKGKKNKDIKENKEMELLLDTIKKKYQHLSKEIAIFNDKYNQEDRESLNLSYFKEVLELFIFFNFSSELIIKILNLNLSLLFLIDLKFICDKEGKAIISDDYNDSLSIISTYLQCDKDMLTKRLVSREYRSPRGSLYVVK